MNVIVVQEFTKSMSNSFMMVTLGDMTVQLHGTSANPTTIVFYFFNREE